MGALGFRDTRVRDGLQCRGLWLRGAEAPRAL